MLGKASKTLTVIEDNADFLTDMLGM